MKLSPDKNIDALMKVGGTIALLFFGNKAFAKARKNSAEKDMDTNVSSGHAASLKQAMNPTGFRWMRFIDGTDKEAIMQLATQITNLDEVNEKYKGMTEGGSVYDDLEGSLSPAEFQKFLSLASKGKTGSYYYAPKSDKVPFNHWVITTAEANVRSTPKYIWQRAFKNNIVKLAPKGYKLGASTGKFAYDEQGKVLFIEFWTFTSKGVKKTYYVAKSQIEFVSIAELAKREKQGKIPLQVIEGLGGDEAEPQQEVISTDTAVIYDEKFNQVGLTTKNIIMGFPIMSLNTGKGTFIQFQTVQGAKRWIRAESAEIIERRL